MRTRSLFAALSLCWLASQPLASAAAPAPSNVHDARVEAAADSYLRPFIDLGVFQGVVLIAREDRILFEKGYGLANVELRVPNTPRQVFRIASISKPFTEVALGRLMEEGRLSLSDRLSRFLPDFPRGDEITLDMLRTHRAGIAHMNSIPYDEEADVPNSLDSMVNVLARQPLGSEPGTRRRYSNGGFALLAHVIEKASGQSYADYLQQEVLEPLGLGRTRHEPDGMVVRDRAYGYTVSAEVMGLWLVAPFQEMATKTGGGSLVSTAGDLRRFLRAMQRDNVLRTATWHTLFPPDSVFQFQGRCPGFNVFMARDFVHDVEVVVLANNYAAGMVGTIGADFLSLARGAEVAKPRWRADVTIDSTRARAYQGTFQAAPGALPYGSGPYHVRWHRGGLVVFRGEIPGDVLVPQGEDSFLLRNHWSELRYVAGPRGSKLPTLRPLWMSGDPVALERVEESQ